MSLYCAGIGFQECGTSGAIEAPYNGWKPYNRCSGLPGRARRAEKGEPMRIEEMLKTERGVRRAPGMSRKEFLRLGGAGMAGAALLGTAGCGVFESGGGGGGGSSNPKNITYNLGDTIRDLDSATTTDSISIDVLLNIASGLYRLDPEARPVPDMAESVKISEDELTYTFTLRDGIKWSTGDPVTAGDFEYAWKRCLNPDTGSQYAYIIYTFVKGAEAYNTGDGSADDVAVKATDDKTLEVEL